MAVLDLVSLDDLAGIPGAPTSQEAVNRIAERIRAICGWHIAPEITETVLLDSQGQDTLLLPTLHLVNVVSVKYWNGSELVDVPGWDARTGWSASSCTIFRAGGFPRGNRIIEVTMTHGYSELPASILDAIVDIAGNGRIVQESLASHSVTFADSTPTWGATSALARHKLGPRP